ncbi:MAG: prolipoprotein diacylglyceryl transferase [Desulfobacterales bacterium S5133MH4]|nr:MAG: prolipoprotein diacylglyceryl transferase [Desulfobacterales bacterium S5133MH4]
MHPVLFRIGPLTLHTYGVFVATAFLSAIALAVREARREGEDANKILDLCFYVLVAAIVGSRILYVLVNWSAFRHDPFEIVRIWHGGLVFYGGFIGAFLVAVWYIKRKGLSFLKTVDIIAPSLAFGQFVGRIGCFFAGCCYGKICDLPWAVTFAHPESLAPKGVPLHPTQLYSSINGLLIYLALVWLRRVKAFEGQIFWTYVLLYAVTRSIIECFRGDDRGMFVEGMVSTSQLIGVIMAVTAIGMMIMLKRQK